MRLALISLASLVLSSLGSELNVEGFAFRPPAGFAAQRLDAYRDSRAGAVAFSAAGGTLSAALVDEARDGAAALLVAVVEGGFDAHPAARDELSGAVVRHFRDQLGLPFTLESARAVPAAVPRIEVLGTIRQEGEARHLLVAAFAGAPRHAVLTFSIPAGRYEALAPDLTASLDTFRNSPTAAGLVSRRILGAVAGALAGALLFSVTLWRRRRRSAAS